MAKMYCSNSGNVQGLVACTNSADTDGCGIDRTPCGPNGAGPNCSPVTSPVPQDIINTYFVTPGVPLNCYRSGTNGSGPVYPYVQWIKFATPENVTGLKIQGVGGSSLKSWVLFHAGSDTYGTNNPIDFPACNNNMVPLTFFGACTPDNQWYTWSNPNAVVGNGIANIYYIAFFYETAGNGSLNFKAKNCTFGQSCAPLNGSISGPTVVCPNSTNTYTAPTAPSGSTYAWSITGNGTIPGPKTGPTVDVVAGSTCNGTYTVYLTITNGACTYQFETEVDVIDNNGPTLTGVPADVTVDCASVPLAASVTAADGCSGVNANGVVLTTTTDAGTCAGNYILHRTWTATDNCGNSTSATQDITVTDTHGPSITCPGDMTIDCAASTDPSNTGTATATDDCSGLASITYNDVDAPGSCAGNHVITRTWTATDNCGNSSNCDQIITLTDTHGPSITCPVDVSIECTASTDPSNTGSATATDDCSGVASITHSDVDAPGNCAGNHVITRTWTATDNCGNSSSCDQTITVTDTEGPSITCPDNMTVSCMNSIPCPSVVLAWVQASATDNCTAQADIVVELSGDTGLPTCNVGEFSRTYTFTATDACGNTSDCSVTYSGTCQNLCTFTQGGWGQAGGAPGTVFGTDDITLIGNLLLAHPGGLTIGTPSTGKYLTITNAACVQTLLPGGGSPAVLKPYGGSNCNYNQPLKNGRLNNVLASQTIALTLNIWLNVSQGKDLGSESLDCIPGIPANVLAKLGANKTVAGLLQLTNDFLGGLNTSPVSASNLNTAVTIINERWDNCVQPVASCSGNNPMMLSIGNLGNPTFHAWKSDDHKVNLRWFIRNSDDVERFVVDRSTDGIEYRTMAEVMPSESDDLENYVTLDNHPGKGINRYQLTIYMKNGDVTTLPEVQISIQKPLPYQMLPNPAKSETWINLTQLNNQKDVTIVVTNCYGQAVLTQKIGEVKDDFFRLDLNNLWDGVYFVSVKVGREIFTDKLIITNMDR